jgi:hypothetical protein
MLQQSHFQIHLDPKGGRMKFWSNLNYHGRNTKKCLLNRPVSKCIISPWGSTQTLAWKKKCQCPGRNSGTLPSQAKRSKAWRLLKFWSYAPDAIPASNCVFSDVRCFKDEIIFFLIWDKIIFYNNVLNLVVYIIYRYFYMNWVLKP